MASDGSVNPWPAQEKIRDGGCRRRHHVPQGRRDAGLRHRLRVRAERDRRPTRAPSRSTRRRARSTGPTTAWATPTTSRRPVTCSTTRRTSTTAPPSTGGPTPTRACAGRRPRRSTRTPPTSTTKNDAYGWAGTYGLSVSPTPSCCTGTRTSPSAPTPPPGRPPGRSTPRPTASGSSSAASSRASTAWPSRACRASAPGRRAQAARARATRTRPRHADPGDQRGLAHGGHGPGLLGLGLGHGQQDADLRGAAQQQHLGQHARRRSPTSGRCPRMGFIDKGLAPGTTYATRCGSPTPTATSCGARCPTPSRSAPARRAPTRDGSSTTAPAPVAAR